MSYAKDRRRSIVRRGLAAAGLLALLSCGGGGSGGGRAASAVRWVLVPESPAFVAYRDATDDGAAVAELAPDRFRAEEFSVAGAPFASPISPPAVGGLCTFPPAFDLREQGRSTPARSPSCPCGSCWTTATIGSLESSMTAFSERDLSENHLQLYAYEGSACFLGGHADLALPYFAAWRGPVDEADYALCLSRDPDGVRLPVRAHVQNVWYLPKRQGPLDLCWIKWALTNLGGVYASTSKGWGIHPTDNTDYLPLPDWEIHAVTIVGWDDAFDRNRFLCTHPSLSLEERKPPGDGAFLVKDNAGPLAWDQGHYWVSYYHQSFAVHPVAFTAEPVGNYARNYQWDPRGGLDFLLLAPEGAGALAAWQGNVFTAAADEWLSAVSFFDLYGDAIDYRVEIHLNPAGGPTSPAGPVVAFDVSPPMRGYFTVPLPTPVKLKKGGRFGVVLRGKDRVHGWPAPLALERKGPKDTAVHAAPGQSFVSTNGTTWQDLISVVYQVAPGKTASLADANLRIKAFTRPILSASAALTLGDFSVAWDLVNEGLEGEWARPMGRQRLKVGDRFEDVGDVFYADRWVGDDRLERPTDDGWVYVPPGGTVQAFSAPWTVELADQVSWQVQRIDPADGFTLMPGLVQYINDLLTAPLQVVSTDPGHGASVNVSSVPVLTVTFDVPIKVGPGFSGIQVQSADASVAVYASALGNVLQIVPSKPLTGGAMGTGGKVWSLHVPKDAVLSASLGNPLVSDLHVSFTITGVN